LVFSVAAGFGIVKEFVIIFRNMWYFDVTDLLIMADKKGGAR
jgi:hypothetical protein